MKWWPLILKKTMIVSEESDYDRVFIDDQDSDGVISGVDSKQDSTKAKRNDLNSIQNSFMKKIRKIYKGPSCGFQNYGSAASKQQTKILLIFTDFSSQCAVFSLKKLKQ